MKIRNMLQSIAMVGLLSAVACDDEGKKDAAAAAKDGDAKGGDAEGDAKAGAEDEAAKAKAAAAAEVEAKERAHAKVTELLPKLYEYGTKDEGVKEIAAIGPHAIGTLTAQLDEHLAAFAKGMEAFGAGKKGTQAEAKKASEHQRKADALFETLLAIGDEGKTAAKKSLDDMPEDKQKGIADMFRSRHSLFDR